jgi:hypothetical protein
LDCSRLLRWPHRIDLVGDAEQRLHVVTDFVRDHVGLREVARRAQARLHRFVESEVDVDLLVAGTVERPHGRLAGAASGRRGAAKQHQPGLAVRAALGLELRAPHVLGVREDCRDKGRHLVVRRRSVRRSLRHRRRLGAAAAQDAKQRQRVDAERPAGHQRDHDGAQADAAAAAEAEASAAHRRAFVAPVLDVVALAVAFPLHRRLLERGGLPSCTKRRWGSPG